MKAVFLGAGSSCGTLRDSSVCPPVAADFGSQLAKRAPCWATKYPALAGVARHLGIELPYSCLEQIWTCIDYYAKLNPALPCQSWLKDAPRELTQALLCLYGRTCDWVADKLPLTEDYTLGRLVKELKLGDVVVSFNYDTLFERLAVRCRPRLPLRTFSRELRRDVVNFVKPHGSTSWCLDFNKRCLFSAADDGSPLLDSLAEEDVDCTRAPLLLGAVPIKSELIQEVQAQYGVSEVFDAVVRQWKAVVAAVSQAKAIVVLGYRFPPEDQYGRFLLAEGMRLRPKSMPVNVDYYELERCREDTSRSILDAFRWRIGEINWKREVTAARIT